MRIKQAAKLKNDQIVGFGMRKAADGQRRFSVQPQSISLRSKNRSFFSGIFLRNTRNSVHIIIRNSNFNAHYESTMRMTTH